MGRVGTFHGGRVGPLDVWGAFSYGWFASRIRNQWEGEPREPSPARRGQGLDGGAPWKGGSSRGPAGALSPAAGGFRHQVRATSSARCSRRSQVRAATACVARRLRRALAGARPAQAPSEREPWRVRLESTSPPVPAPLARAEVDRAGDWYSGETGVGDVTSSPSCGACSNRGGRTTAAVEEQSAPLRAPVITGGAGAAASEAGRLTRS